jgi:hypothetical protein
MGSGTWASEEGEGQITDETLKFNFYEQKEVYEIV